MRIERHIVPFAAAVLVVASLWSTPAHAWSDTREADRILVESTTPKEATDPEAGARRHAPTGAVSSTAPAPTVQVTTMQAWLDAWRQLITWLAG